MKLTPDIEKSILSMREVSERLREPNKAAEKPKTQPDAWADEHGAERTAFLRKAWADWAKYPSVTSIGVAITLNFGRKVSKCATGAKASRLGLGPRREKKTPRVVFQKGYTKSNDPAVQAMRAENAPRPPIFPEKLRLDPMPESGITFEQLKTGMCKFALGGVRDEVKYFCGEETASKKHVYCPRHQEIALPRLPQKRKAA
jgi:hypothetical protein